MPVSLYYGATFTLYISLICCGLTIKDLGIVFDVVTAFGLVFLSFLWPGLFYLLAENKFGDPKTSNERTRYK